MELRFEFLQILIVPCACSQTRNSSDPQQFENLRLGLLLIGGSQTLAAPMPKHIRQQMYVSSSNQLLSKSYFKRNSHSFQMLSPGRELHSFSGAQSSNSKEQWDMNLENYYRFA
jgi:hypothetical protein